MRNHIPAIERLAGTLRASRFATLDRKELELALGRDLTKFERRGLDMAAHSRSLPNSVRQSATARNDAIRQWLQLKGHKRPSVMGAVTDLQTVNSAPAKQRFSEVKKTTVLDGNRLHPFAHGLDSAGAGHEIRKAKIIASPDQWEKPVQWDKKR